MIKKNLVDFFLKKDSICYNIGSSTGGVLSSIIETKVGKKTKIIGIEPINKIVETSHEKHKSFKNIKYLNKDILSVELLKKWYNYQLLCNPVHSTKGKTTCYW